MDRQTEGGRVRGMASDVPLLVHHLKLVVALLPRSLHRALPPFLGPFLPLLLHHLAQDTLVQGGEEEGERGGGSQDGRSAAGKKKKKREG
jgi:hypothetical protein